MAELTGSEILAKSLKNEGTDILFFLMGGPMLLAESSCIKEGIRPLDVRHEQSAAFMGQAYSRLLQKPSVCMAASGPGVINLTTGIANALIDCCPVVAVGGSSPIGQNGRQVFQEIDQLAIMKPCTKWADRIYNLKRIPEQVNCAFQKAMSGKPGPVYLDFPGDVLYAKIPEEQVDWSLSGRPLLNARPLGDPNKVDTLVDAIAKARQPIILSGSGVIWSKAWPELQELVEKTGIPFYTTPQGRGVVPDDHEYSYLTMRSSAFRDADLIIVVGTRMNYIIGHAARPASTVAPRSRASISMRTKSPPRHAGSISASSVTARRCSANSSMRAPSASMRIISPHGGERCPTAKRQNAKRRAPTSRWTRRRSIRCDCATRSRISCSVTPSWWSTGRKS
jgi:thiamine pyrophosphate-dependent acetolactate synthase large subunit-like protein